jgi:hypothetical protein
VNGEAILSVTTAVVSLTQLAKWSGLPTKLAPLGVVLLSLLGVGFWAWTQGGVSRELAFDYFAGWVSVAMASAGVFGFVREAPAVVTAMRKGTGNGQ